MKKLISILKTPIIAGGFFCLTLSGVAHANGSDVNFYAGAGLNYNNYSLGDIIKEFKSHKSNGMGLVVPVLGVKFHENFGLEFGYTFNKKFKLQGNITRNAARIGMNNSFDVKVKSAYIDFLVFMPLGEQFELIGGVGIGNLKAKPSKLNLTPSIAGTTGTGNVITKSKTGCRVKIGTQYNFTNNFAIRALATYQRVGNNIQINRNLANTTVGTAATIYNSSGTFVSDIKSIGLSAIYRF
jgi:opacity protein-like surface antigen